MKVVFIKGFKTWNPFNWVVCIRGLSKYSHCEFLFRDNMMFGATARSGECRFATLKEGPHMAIFDTTITVKEENLIRAECQKYEGKKYDYRGLLGFAFKTDDLDTKNKYFCSELMTIILEKCTKYVSPKAACRVHPGRLCEYLKKYNIIKK